MAFWDSSALVPLCVNEGRSKEAGRLWNRFLEKWIWRETPVEIESSLARLRRENILDDTRYAKARSRFQTLERDLTPVSHEPRLIELARSLPASHGLRSLDSLQLASALIWCKEFPRNKDFVSGDSQLLEAAENLGFAIHDIN